MYMYATPIRAEREHNRKARAVKDRFARYIYIYIYIYIHTRYIDITVFLLRGTTRTQARSVTGCAVGKLFSVSAAAAGLSM